MYVCMYIRTCLAVVGLVSMRSGFKCREKSAKRILIVCYCKDAFMKRWDKDMSLDKAKESLKLTLLYQCTHSCNHIHFKRHRNRVS